jgi:hypothetical protein
MGAFCDCQLYTSPPCCITDQHNSLQHVTLLHAMYGADDVCAAAVACCTYDSCCCCCNLEPLYALMHAHLYIQNNNKCQRGPHVCCM